MVRILTLGLAALLFLQGAPAQEEKTDGKHILKVDGKLSPDDPRDAKLKKSPHKVHECKLSGGEIYVIEMTAQFDTYLRLEDSKRKHLALNDDIAPPKNLNSRLIIKAPADDTYRIIATAYEGSGAYTLTVRKGTAEELATADPFHALIGKPAPEMVAEHGLNGETRKLSDLKGKVVLVDFWAVWCGPCIQTFPHLRDWHNAHHKDGLEILGVTTYFERFGFDKDTGRLKQVGKINLEEKKIEGGLSPAEEHAMLKDFAAHHKLQHRLITLTKANWERSSKDYRQNGIPHVALVDRKGIVRMIRVGSGPENAEALHDEIKKLIAEK